jgi:hypothetical protein
VGLGQSRRVQRFVTVIALLGVAFALYAVWQHGHTDAARVLASWTRTPGVLNPDVRQETIGRTICVQGWTRTIRPPTEYTSELKLKQMAEYGLGGSSSDYQEDHLISLELGGHPTDPRNLWPEPRPHAEEVDKIENELNRRICSGEISLAEGRRRESHLKHTSG